MSPHAKTIEFQEDVATFNFFQISHIFSAMESWRLQFTLKCWYFIEMGKSSFGQLFLSWTPVFIILTYINSCKIDV